MIHYFGTDLDSAGHYFWQLEGNQIYRGKMDFGRCPFNPEGLPYSKDKAFRNGDTEFYNFAGFSILAIQGSCSDSRPGSKSIFFIEEGLNKGPFKALLLDMPIAKKIIEKMPFEVQW